VAAVGLKHTYVFFTKTVIPLADRVDNNTMAAPAVYRDPMDNSPVDPNTA
jgi:hypothetical protein